MYQGEMPIEELMKMYSAAENESTDMQSDVESSQESSEEGRKMGLITSGKICGS